MDAYWRAANYLSAGQSYLYDNPLLKRPQTLTDLFAKNELAILAKSRRPCW
jgi:phosphoketolase